MTERGRGPWSRILDILATSLVVTVMATVVLAAGMRYWTGLPRLVPVRGLDAVDAYDPRLSADQDQERFRSELAPLIAERVGTEAKVLAILEWVMNQFGKVEKWYDKSSWSMVEHGRAGGGLICGGLAQVFKDALLANGIPARSLTFQRNPLSLFDTHAAVEVWIDGKWRLYDPTFHVALRAGEERVGVSAAHDWYIKGRGKKVETEFLGDVKYPARLETYPIRYEVFFDNPYVDRRRDIGMLANIPIVGAWLARELTYASDDTGLDYGAQDFYRAMYYTTVVALPAINLLLLLAVGLVWRQARRARQT